MGKEDSNTGTDLPVMEEQAISRENLDFFKAWFSSYVASFATDDPDVMKNIDLKHDHTLRVCGEALGIGTALGLDGFSLAVAEITALFHDVGRFDQYRRFRTFSDKKSVNHALFGVEILKEHKVLDRLEPSLGQLILEVVACHNRATLSEDMAPRPLFFSRLLRDADKLDIWWVLTEYYRMKAEGETNETIELDLPDTAGTSETIRESLVKGQVILFDSMKNLNDFKLFQAGWVYDLYFTPALERMRERNYLGKIQNALPDTEDIRDVFSVVRAWVDQRLGPTA